MYDGERCLVTILEVKLEGKSYAKTKNSIKSAAFKNVEIRSSSPCSAILRIARINSRQRANNPGAPAEQCENMHAYYTAKAEPLAIAPLQRIEAADRFMVLKDDKRPIFSAASQAQQAVDWIFARQPGTQQEATPNLPQKS